MGYRGKLEAQESARTLRAEGLTLEAIASRLGVSKSSVSVWVRDVDFAVGPRRPARRRGPNSLQRRKSAQIEAARLEAIDRVGIMDHRAFLVAGAALYAGEGAKQDGDVRFANSDPRLVRFFCAWLRFFFTVDEDRFRARFYLHEGLDLDAAEFFWSDVTGLPRHQFRTAHRVPVRSGYRTTKHKFGCAYVRYCSVDTHRKIMGLIDALLTSGLPSGVAQSAERVAVNH
jgi:AcrR family transcriptional regulator